MLDLKHELKLDKTRDEKARMNFVSGLRAHVLNDMASGMRAVWDAEVEPAFRRSRGRRPKDGPEVHAAMKPNESFKFYSSLRVTTQDLVWQSVFPALERNRGALKEKAARLARGSRSRTSKARGTLTLQPGFDVPRSVSAIDVHLMAGNYDGEYEEGDLAAGSLYDNGLAVFSFGLMGQNLDDIGQSIAGFIKGDRFYVVTQAFSGIVGTNRASVRSSSKRDCPDFCVNGPYLPQEAVYGDQERVTG